MSDNLNHWVHIAAAYRQELAEAKAHQAQLETDLANTAEWARLDQHRTYTANVKQNLEQAETALRDAGWQAYQDTGDKAPHPAIKIKLFTVLKYDLGRAKDYCIAHLPNALKLDARTFEKAAPALGLDWVEEAKEPRAEIAGDLSAYLEVTA